MIAYARWDPEARYGKGSTVTHAGRTWRARRLTMPRDTPGESNAWAPVDMEMTKPMPANPMVAERQ